MPIKDYPNSALSANWASVGGIILSENQAAASLNDSMRVMGKDIAAQYKDNDSSLVLSGSGTSFTINTNDSAAGLINGRTLRCTFPSVPTGEFTLNVDSLGAKKVMLFDRSGARRAIPLDVLLVRPFRLIYLTAADGGVGAWVMLDPVPQNELFASYTSGTALGAADIGRTFYAAVTANPFTFALPAASAVPAGSVISAVFTGTPAGYQTARATSAGGNIVYGETSATTFYLAGSGEKAQFLSDGTSWFASFSASAPGANNYLFAVGSGGYTQIPNVSLTRFTFASITNTASFFSYPGAGGIFVPVSGKYLIKPQMLSYDNAGTYNAGYCYTGREASGQESVWSRDIQTLGANTSSPTMLGKHTIVHMSQGDNAAMWVYGPLGVYYNGADTSLTVAYLGR